LQKSLEADAKQPLAHEVLGQLRETVGKIPEGVSHYRAAIHLWPDFGKTHLNPGMVLARQGDRGGAAAEFRLAQSDADPQVRQMAVAGLAAAGAR